MDLSTFELTTDAVFVQLSHPKTNVPLFVQKDGADDRDQPIGVCIYGADSSQFKKRRQALQNRVIEAKSKRKNLTAEEIDDATDQTLADCITELKNVVWKGETFTAPKDNRRFIRLMPWAVEQIDEAMADRSRFMPALATS